MEEAKQVHELEPLYDNQSQILILGSFPSVKSRESCFYYGHPQNRFWKVVAGVFEEPVPTTIDEKKQLLITHHIALWDVIESCTITGSSDSSIKDVTVNDMRLILNTANIKNIYVNGNKAYELYRKYCENDIGREAIKLPSTSPANAAWQLDRLINEWSKIRNGD